MKIVNQKRFNIPKYRDSFVHFIVVRLHPIIKGLEYW